MVAKNWFVTFGLCAVLGGGVYGSKADAQTIKYKVGTNTDVTVTSGEDIEIDVGAVDGTLLVRIWDPTLDGNSLPNDSVGKVTITGTFTSGQLRILVAGTADAWSNDRLTQLLNPGLLHLGLNGSDGIVVTDATLRARTRLSAYTAGDIRGVTTLGQFQRVQCGVPGSTPTGIISATITSIANGNAFATDENPIAVLIAGDEISGTITATAGSIGLIQVGPHEGAAGISGSIIAEAGAINSIFCTGPIGSSTTSATISAANGIGQIRTAASDTGTILARRIEAAIVAHEAFLGPTPPTLDDPASDGVLSMLGTAGDPRWGVWVG